MTYDHVCGVQNIITATFGSIPEKDSSLSASLHYDRTRKDILMSFGWWFTRTLFVSKGDKTGEQN